MTTEDIKKILPNIEILENEPLSKHTTFKVGGPARLFVTVSKENDIVKLIGALRENGEKFEVIGRGSNLLVSDKGYDGVIVSIKSKENGARVLLAKEEGCDNECSGEAGDDKLSIGTVKIYAPAGDSIIALSTMARDLSLTGLEFACGIPGSVGGAIIMNAGAHGGEVSDVVESVKVIRCCDTEAEKDCEQTDAQNARQSARIVTLSREGMNFRYRGSLAMDEGLVVLGATFALKRGVKEEIAKKMSENLAKRTSSQPLEFPSAGSTFKKPAGDFAGRLIEEAGLKGYKIGGAKVSEKHAGFVVNVGDATASDIVELCDYVSKTVYEKSGVKLEMEVRKIGF